MVTLTHHQEQHFQQAQLREAWFGDLDGAQTSAAAEMAAVWWALHIFQGTPQLTIITDCDVVAKGWAKGRHCQP